MGMLDFLKKKKDESLGLGDTGLDLSTNPVDMSHDMSHNSLDPMSSMSNMSNNSAFAPQSMSNMNSFQQSYQPPAQPVDISKDIQILSLKMDAIKAELDSINQRIKNIEIIAQKEQQTPIQKRWY